MRRGSHSKIHLKSFCTCITLFLVISLGGITWQPLCLAATSSIYGYMVGDDGFPPQGGVRFDFYLGDLEGNARYYESTTGFFFFGGLIPGRYCLYGHWVDGTWKTHQSGLLVVDLEDGEDRGPVFLRVDDVGTLVTTLTGLQTPTTRLHMVAKGMEGYPRWVAYGSANYTATLMSGDYEIRAEGDYGWTTPTAEVHITRGSQVNLDLAFPQGGLVGGTVRDGNGNPVNATVYLDWRNGSYNGVGASDPTSGRFDMGGLRWPPGPHTLWAQTGSLAAPPVAFDLTSGGSVDIPLTIRPKGSISGRVMAGGEPAAWINVQVLMGPESNDFLASTSTDANGYYSLNGLPPGDLTVRVRQRRGLTLKSVVNLPPGGNLSGVDFAFPAILDVTVRVTDWQGQPVNEADVILSYPSNEVQPAWYLTDDTGMAVIDQYPAASGCSIVVQTTKWDDFGNQVPLFRAGPVTVDVDETHTEFSLQLPQPGRVSGTVLATLPDPTQVDVVLVLEGGANFRTPVQLQGSSLTFSFQGLPPGVYQAYALETQAPYRVGRIAHLTLNPGEDLQDLVLVIGHGGTITGIVLDSDGSPVPDAEVILIGQTTESARTDSSGGFSFSFLNPGSYQVTAKKGLMEGDLQSVTLAEGQQVSVTLTVPKGGVIQGTVRYSSGAPVAGARVELFMGGEAGFVEQTADQSGMFRFDFLPTEQYWILATSPVGTLSAGVEISLGPQEIRSVDIVLPPGATISGIVIDCFGQPVAGATVDLSGYFQKVTDAQGAFSFQDLAQGYYRLQASKSGSSSSQVSIIVSEGEQRSDVTLMLGSSSPPEVTMCYPHIWNPNGELVVGAGGYTYVRIYVHASASGAVMDPSNVKVWLDGVEVTPQEIQTYLSAQYGWISVTYVPSPPEKLLGPHRVEFAAADTLGNCMRYVADVTGVPQPFFRSAFVSPTLFSPNGDGFMDTLTLRAEPSVSRNVMIFARLGGYVQLVPLGGSLWGGELTPGRLATGSHSVIFYGYDNNHRDEYGNPVQFLEVSVAVESDITAPDIQVTTPSPTNVQGEIKGTLSEPNGLTFFRLRRSGQANWDELAPWEGPWSYPVTMAEGANQFELWARDTLGNENHKTVTIVLDTTPPSIRVISPQDGLEYRPFVPVQIELFDAGTGVDLPTRTLTLDGRNVDTSGFQWDGVTWSSTLGPLQEGIHNLVVRCCDKIDNCNLKSVWFPTFIRPPKIVYRSPGAGSTNARFVLEVTVRAEDWSGLGLQSGKLMLDGSEVPSQFDPASGVLSYKHNGWLTQGEHTLRVSITDMLHQTTTESWTFLQRGEEQFTGVVYTVPSTKFYSPCFGHDIVMHGGPMSGHGPAEVLQAWGIINAPPMKAQMSLCSSCDPYEMLPPRCVLEYNPSNPTCRRVWCFQPHSRDWLDGVSDPDQPGVPGRGPSASAASTAHYITWIDPNLFPGDYVPVLFRNPFETSGNMARLMASYTSSPYNPTGFVPLESRMWGGGGWLSEPLFVPKSAIGQDGKIMIGVRRHSSFATVPLRVALGDPVFTLPGPRIEALFPQEDGTVSDTPLVEIGAKFKDDAQYGAPYAIDPGSVRLEFNGQAVAARYDPATRTIKARVAPGTSGDHVVKVVAKNMLGVETSRTWHFQFVFYGYPWQTLSYQGNEYRVYVKFERELSDQEIQQLPQIRLGPNQFFPAVTGINIIKRVSDFRGGFKDYLVGSDSLKRELIQAAYRMAFYRAISQPQQLEPLSQGLVDWFDGGANAASGEFLFALGEVTGQDLAEPQPPLVTMKEAIVAALVSKDSPSEIPGTYEEIYSALSTVLQAESKLLGQFEKLEQLKKITKYSKTADKALDKILGLKDTIEVMSGVVDFLSNTAALVDEVWRTIFTAYWQASIVDGFRDQLAVLEPKIRSYDSEVARAMRELIYFDPAMLYDDIAFIIAKSIVENNMDTLKDALKDALKTNPYALAVLKGIDIFYKLAEWTNWDDLHASAHHGFDVSKVERATFSAWVAEVMALRGLSRPPVERLTSVALASRLYLTAASKAWGDAIEITKKLKALYDRLFMDYPWDFDGSMAIWESKIQDAEAALQEVVPETPGSTADVLWLLDKVTTIPLYGRPVTLQAEVLSPVWVLITDPQGRKIGTDSSGNSLNEIPGATYSGPQTDPVVFMLPTMDGTYNIEALGTGEGNYHIVFTALDDQGGESSSQVLEGTAHLGVVTLHQITVDEGEVTADSTGPLAITEPTLTPAGASLRVNWETNLPTEGWVRFGLTEACEQGTVPSQAAMAQQHEAVLTGLSFQTRYYIQAMSRDGLGREVGGPVTGFSLQDLLDRDPPRAPTGVKASYGPDGAGLLTWGPNSEPDLAGYRVVPVLSDGTPLGPNPLQEERFFYFNTVQGSPIGYSVVAEDRAGNLSPMSQVVVPQLNPQGHEGDQDGDGLPDTWEMENGLDPLSGSDAAQDSDSDGLSNTQEYQAGTDPQDPDTDGDGLPDGWELKYALDPLDDGSVDPRNGPDGDPDGDGLTNLEEFLYGTDPVNAATRLRVDRLVVEAKSIPRLTLRASVNPLAGMTFNPGTQALSLDVQGAGAWVLDPGSMIQRGENRWSYRSRGREGLQKLDLDLRTGELSAVLVDRALREVPSQIRLTVSLGDEGLGPTVIPLGWDARRRKGSFTYGRGFPLEDHLFLDGYATAGGRIHLWGTFSSVGMTAWRPTQALIVTIGDHREEIAPELLVEGTRGLWCYANLGGGAYLRALLLDTLKGRFHVIIATDTLPQAGMLALATAEFSVGYEWDPTVQFGLGSGRPPSRSEWVSALRGTACVDPSLWR